MNTIAYFSYTGNTKYLAQKLQSYLGESTTQLVDLAFDDRSKLKAGQHLVIMFAIHAFNPPGQVVDFVKNLEAKSFETIHFISVGCNDGQINEMASTELQTIIKYKEGCMGVNRVLAMPLTLIKKFPQDMGTSVVANTLSKLQGISSDILAGKRDTINISNGVKLVRTVGKLEKQAAKLFGLELHANNTCISCGICERECPMKNIKLNESGKPKFNFNCSMCLKCIYDCPKQAIQPRFSKFMTVKGGYHLDHYLK